MKIKLLQFLLVLLICSISYSSCKKEKETEEEEKEEVKTTPQPENITPTKPDATGVCIAIQTVSYQDMPFVGITEIVFGAGLAVFPESAGSATFRDAGTVSLEQVAMEKQTNNAFFTKFDASNTTGIEYAGLVDWVVSGQNGVPAIDTSVTDMFPSKMQIKTQTNAKISLGSSFILETDELIIDADSIVYAVYGPENSLIVTRAGGTGSNEFSAADMGTVGKGMGFVQITAYKYVGEMSSGAEKIYFINQKVNTVAVNFE